MQTVIVTLIVGASVGWFAHRIYKTAVKEDTGCCSGCGCNCDKHALSGYQKDRNNQPG